MPKRKYLNPEYDPYFYRGKKLTKTQKAWNKEAEKALNRAESWVRKFHAIADVPKKPKEYGKIVTQKAIEAIKNFTWPKIGKQAQESFRKEYEQRYEEGQEGIYFPKPQYTPPTESDWLKVPFPEPTPTEMPDEYEEPDEDGYTETVVSRDEIIAWIDANINTITVERELDGVREQLSNLVLEAADAYGDYDAYLSYLEENAGNLNELATKAMSGYVGKGGRIYQEDPQAISKFATVLNLKRPLDQSQSERLENEGWVSYDFND